MTIEFDVKMTTSKMYDYMLKHNMTSFSGILGEFIGLLLIVAFFLYGNVMYLLCGVVIVLYMPVALFIKSSNQVKLNPVFKEKLHYILDETGVTVRSGENEDSLPWSEMYKATSTTSSIILYTNKVNACVFPKSDLGGQKDEVIKMISTHMDPRKVNIR